MCCQLNVMAYAGMGSIQGIMGYETITWPFISKFLPPITLRAERMEEAI